MRRWKIDLHDGHALEVECPVPPSVMELTPPPAPVVQPAASVEGPITLTVAEAAELLGVCVETMYTLVHRADFPKLRIGRAIRIDRRALEDWSYQQAGGARV